MMSCDELKEMITETVREALDEHNALNPANDELLTPFKASRLFDVAESTIDKWRRAGKLPAYKISNKTYFMKSEVLRSLKVLKVTKRKEGPYGN